MIKKYIINGKEIEAPGKFSLSVVIQRTPQERLIELQQLYNSMEYEVDNELNRMKLKTWYGEMIEIVKLYPELNDTIKLKNYGF